MIMIIMIIIIHHPSMLLANPPAKAGQLHEHITNWPMRDRRSFVRTEKTHVLYDSAIDTEKDNISANKLSVRKQGFFQAPQ
jgi:hypothetical protein